MGTAKSRSPQLAHAVLDTHGRDPRVVHRGRDLPGRDELAKHVPRPGVLVEHHQRWALEPALDLPDRLLVRRRRPEDPGMGHDRIELAQAGPWNPPRDAGRDQVEQCRMRASVPR
jgi:hypothetical protein